MPRPEATLWHTGSTGTSLLISRPLGLAVILLTNAVHPMDASPSRPRCASRSTGP